MHMLWSLTHVVGESCWRASPSLSVNTPAGPLDWFHRLSQCPAHPAPHWTAAPTPPRRPAPAQLSLTWAASRSPWNVLETQGLRQKMLCPQGFLIKICILVKGAGHRSLTPLTRNKRQMHWDRKQAGGLPGLGQRQGGGATPAEYEDSSMRRTCGTRRRGGHTASLMY